MSNQTTKAQPQKTTTQTTTVRPAEHNNSKALPIIAALVLGGLALSPIFLHSFGNAPQAAEFGRSAFTQTDGAPTANGINPASDEDTKVGYSLGYMMGSNVYDVASDLRVQDIVQGLQDGFANKPTNMTPEQMQQTVMAYEQRQTAKMLQDNLAKGEAFLAQNAKKPNVKTTASGLQYEVLQEGTGAKPKATDIVAVQYEGKTIDGKVFDSSAKHGGEPVVFPLNQVIPGWTEGVQLMNEGAKYRFYIPAKLAYGEQGAPGAIEPNSVLIFDIELVKVNPPTDSPAEPQGAVQGQEQGLDAATMAELQRQLEAQMGAASAAQ